MLLVYLPCFSILQFIKNRNKWEQKGSSPLKQYYIVKYFCFYFLIVEYIRRLRSQNEKWIYHELKVNICKITRVITLDYLHLSPAEVRLISVPSPSLCQVCVCIHVCMCLVSVSQIAIFYRNVKTYKMLSNNKINCESYFYQQPLWLHIKFQNSDKLSWGKMIKWLTLNFAGREKCRGCQSGSSEQMSYSSWGSSIRLSFPISSYHWQPQIYWMG